MAEDGEDDLQDATSERQDPIFATPPRQNHRFGAVNPCVQGVQDGAQFGQVWLKLGQVQLKLASEGDLEPF